MIDYIDSNSDRVKSEDDLPIDDVNIVTFLIKVVLHAESQSSSFIARFRRRC